MRSTSGGPRVLLRRLRETMAEKVSAQERLDKIVVLIAANYDGERQAGALGLLGSAKAFAGLAGFLVAGVFGSLLAAIEAIAGVATEQGAAAVMAQHDLRVHARGAERRRRGDNQEAPEAGGAGGLFFHAGMDRGALAGAVWRGGRAGAAGVELETGAGACAGARAGSGH